LALAEAVRRAPARLGLVRLVTVDGPAGSGKTTLAASLARELGDAPVVHLDDLYEGWSGLAEPLWARLSEWVLEPVRAGGAGRFRRYDWHAGRFAEWRDVPRHEALVVEGVGAGARPVDGWASLRVWVEAPWPLRLRRGIARDGEPMRDEWVRWAEREAAHFAADGTRDRADVLVDGSAPPVG
jgi:energy-coupling factor transporter ATP-binding protein EcfA2